MVLSLNVRDDSGLMKNWLQSATESRGWNLEAAEGPNGCMDEDYTGVQGAEPLEAVVSFTFERPVLDCQNSIPLHFHLIYTDLGDDKIWIETG